MSTTSSPLDDLNPLAAINKQPPPPLPSHPPTTSPPFVHSPPTSPTSPSPSEVSDDALLSGPTPTSSSHPLQSSSSGSTNGFSHGHAHLHPPNLRLQGLSHLETFSTNGDGTAGSADGAVGAASQPSSPAAPSPTSTSYLTAPYFPSSSASGPASDPLAGGSPVPVSGMTASPSIGTLAAATFAGIRADLSTMTAAGNAPLTPTTATGYAGSMITTPHAQHQQQQQQQQQQHSHVGAHTQQNGHAAPQFFAPSRPGPGPPPAQQLQLINTAGPGMMQPMQQQHQQHTPQMQQMQSMHPHYQHQQQQQQQQHQHAHPQQQQQQAQQQRHSGGAATPGSAAKSGFFSKLFKGKDEGPVRGVVERPPPLPIYMQRLRLTHDWHYKNIHQLADRKKKYEQKHAEEVNQWMAWALWPLASLAHAFYLKNLQHLNALLSLEGKFMDNCIEHITVVNAVCEGKLSEAVIYKDMMSAVGDGSVKAQEEVDAMFWPADADDTKALCKRLYEETKRLEAQYVELQAKLKKRESLEVRRKKVQDWLMRGLVHKDTIKADAFHHHPLDAKVQAQFTNLMLDQRGEEGKLMKRFLDMQVTHRSRMQAPAILHFTDYMIGSMLKSYALDERTEPILRIYTYRLIFPRIPEAMSALITAEERDKVRQLAAKIAWLRTLTPKQLGIEEENIPPDFVHDSHYTPLAAPPGSLPDLASPRTSPTGEEKKEGPLSSLEPSTAPPPAASASSPTPGTSATATAGASTPGATAPGAAPTPAAAAAPFTPSAASHPELFSPHPPRVEDDLTPRKMVPDSFPYADAINQLALLSYDVVPFDMFFRVVQAVRLVHQYHKQYTRANREARARAQTRALTYDDPFTSFMTKLVDESNRKAEELDRRDEEEKERRTKEAKEAELKKQQDAAAAAHHRHTSSVGGAAPPSPLASLITTTDPPLPPLDPLTASATNPAGATDDPSAVSPATAGGAPSSNLLSTPQKTMDHPLAPHHLNTPPTPSEPLHFTSPAPVPSLPAPAPVIPERPQEETPLNADQLTPLCVWIVIHANVPSLPARLGQIQRFVPQDWRQFGEAGYSFCQVETAAYYVEHLTEDTLGHVRAGEDGLIGGAGGLPPPSLTDAVIGIPDRVSSPAVAKESPSGNMLSPGRGPTHSASMDGLRRKGTQDDVFSDLLERDNNVPPPTLDSPMPSSEEKPQ